MRFPSSIATIMRTPREAFIKDLHLPTSCPLCGPIESVRERITIYIGRSTRSYWCLKCDGRIKTPKRRTK